MNLKEQFVRADIENLKIRRSRLETAIKRQKLTVKGLNYKIKNMEILLE